MTQLDAAAAGNPGALTVAAYASQWIERRRGLGVASVNDEETRLRLHVLPTLGAELLTSIRPKHIATLILDLRAAAKLSPRSIRHIAGHLHTMFGAARREELIDSNPVDLERGILPKKADQDPTWRHEAIFARAEVELLLGDPRVPLDRRVVYVGKALFGMRHSEWASCTWAAYDTATTPLGRVNLGLTKSKVPRAVPVHPVAAAILADWRRRRRAEVIGPPPGPDDLIVPTRNNTERDATDAQRDLQLDLETLDLRTRAGEKRKRRGHDLRRTFISLALEDGARRDIIEAISHGPRGDIISVYTQLPWPVMCAEILKLRIQPRRGAGVLPLHRPLHKNGRWRNDLLGGATPTGFERVSTPAPPPQTLDIPRADTGLTGSSEAIRVVGPLHAVLEALTTGDVAGAVALLTELLSMLEGRKAAGA